MGKYIRFGWGDFSSKTASWKPCFLFQVLWYFPKQKDIWRRLAVRSSEGVCFHLLSHGVNNILKEVFLSFWNDGGYWQRHPVNSTKPHVIDRVTLSTSQNWELLTGSPCQYHKTARYWQGHSVSSILLTGKISTNQKWEMMQPIAAFLHLLLTEF